MVRAVLNVGAMA